MDHFQMLISGKTLNCTAYKSDASRAYALEYKSVPGNDPSECVMQFDYYGKRPRLLFQLSG